MLLFIFLDGIGIGPDDPNNPFASTPLPALEFLWGGRMVLDEGGVQTASHVARPIDASMGIEGLPQSATGQTSLFTGQNGPQIEGMHISAFPTRALRAAIAEHSVLKQARDAGFRVTFANAFSPAYWEQAARRRNRHSATTLTNLAAGLPFRDFEDLLAGRAVYWDITHEIARASYAPELPYIPPAEAGRRLALLAASHDFTLYETFLPDLVGHRRIDWRPGDLLKRIDGFLQGVFDHLPSSASLLITSDHGNLEDPTTKGHTYHAVPLIVTGVAVPHFAEVHDLTGITPAIMAYLRSLRSE